MRWQKITFHIACWIFVLFDALVGKLAVEFFDTLDLVNSGILDLQLDDVASFALRSK